MWLGLKSPKMKHPGHHLCFEWMHCAFQKNIKNGRLPIISYWEEWTLLNIGQTYAFDNFKQELPISDQKSLHSALCYCLKPDPRWYPKLKTRFYLWHIVSWFCEWGRSRLISKAIDINTLKHKYDWKCPSDLALLYCNIQAAMRKEHISHFSGI